MQYSITHALDYTQGQSKYDIIYRTPLEIVRESLQMPVSPGEYSRYRICFSRYLDFSLIFWSLNKSLGKIFIYQSLALSCSKLYNYSTESLIQYNSLIISSSTYSLMLSSSAYKQNKKNWKTEKDEKQSLNTSHSFVCEINIDLSFNKARTEYLLLRYSRYLRRVICDVTGHKKCKQNTSQVLASPWHDAGINIAKSV